MFHLVYSSVAAQPISGRELIALLPHYREKNQRLGITGLLLYKEGEFMQALEGEEAAVRALFATIQHDPRHRQVHLHSALAVPKRHFPQWSMGFKNLEIDADAAPPGYTPHPKFPPPQERTSWKGAIAIGMLASFMHEY